MIKRVSHTTVWVLDQERAKKFYTEKLGFEVRTDQTMGSFRWLTVGAPGQPDLEVVLMPIGASPMLDEGAAAQIRALVEAGKLGGGVFEVEDCRKAYEALVAKGVQFMGPPKDQPYGTEALLRDDSGNWFSMSSRP
jgi:predicted enzyme related to lactoylglutathione lyase